MGRVINTESAGKERNQLSKAIVLALRHLMQQDGVNSQTRDLVAFIVFSLENITATIDVSVEAWEKRGYWVKADRYRMDWAWAEKHGKAMRAALFVEDWPGVAATAARVSEKLKGVVVPQNHRLGTPWEGAWDKLQGEKRSE